MTSLHDASSGKPVEEFVVGAGEGQGPGVAAAEAEGRGGKRDAGERVVVRSAADYAGEFCSHPGCGTYAVASEADCEMHAVDFSRVRHYVHCEIECAAPDVFDFCVAQLGIDFDHSLAEEFGAFADGAFGFGEEGCAATEEHAIVGR